MLIGASEMRRGLHYMVLARIDTQREAIISISERISGSAAALCH